MRRLLALLLLAAAPAPAGAAAVTVQPGEILASANTHIRVAVTLDRPLPGGELVAGAPAALRRTPASGIRATTLSARTITLSGGRSAELAFTDHGLPAGTYVLPLTLRDANGAEHALPPARLRVRARRREGDEEEDANPWAREAIDITGDNREESEAFIGADPTNPASLLSLVNSANGLVASHSTDGGSTWTGHAFPFFVDVGTALEQQEYTCDPVIAADAGTGTAHPAFWFGGVTECTSNPARPSRIVLARLDETTGTVTGAAGLPIPAGSDGQDKPMIAFDQAARRLYATWISFSGDAATVVLSWCDAGADGRACEDGSAWHAPVAVTDRGSFTYPDVAVAPNGRVEVVWWDYSNANAIAGAECAAPCSGTFVKPRTIALLDATGGIPLPFGCPIPVAPGGRVGPAPNVEVDRDGRVWVAWGDLRAGSGARRCEALPDGFTPPTDDELSWDSFVASAASGLPGAAEPSARAGTRLITDGQRAFATSSDDFFPWLATDRATGTTWAALYSTGRDATRHSTLFFGLSVKPDGSGGHFVGPANQLSAAPSSYWSSTTADCCRFQNDFGDYEGAAAAQGRFFATWADDSRGDGDAYLWRGPIDTVAFTLDGITLAETTPGDGQFEPGERVTLRLRVRNTGTESARGTSSEGPVVTLASDPGASVTSGTAQLPVLSPGQSAQAEPPLEVDLDPVADCKPTIALRVFVSAREGRDSLPVTLPVACPVVTPTPSATPTATATPEPARITTLVVPRRQKLSQLLRHGVLVTVGCGEPCRVRLRAYVSTRTAARRLHVPVALGTRTGTLARPLQGLRIRLTASARRAIRRALARRVRRLPLRVSGQVVR